MEKTVLGPGHSILKGCYVTTSGLESCSTTCCADGEVARGFKAGDYSHAHPCSQRFRHTTRSLSGGIRQSLKMSIPPSSRPLKSLSVAGSPNWRAAEAHTIRMVITELNMITLSTITQHLAKRQIRAFLLGFCGQWKDIMISISIGF